MRRILTATAVMAIAATALAFTQQGNRQFRELLNGYKEAAAPISTTVSSQKPRQAWKRCWGKI